MSSRPPPRSQSVGSIPREKKHPTSRVESASGASLDVRCACQYFQCDSLLPERVNPVGSRPESNIGFVSDSAHYESSTEHGLFVERPGMQYDQLSTRSYNVGHGHHPNADKISCKSFAMGSQEAAGPVVKPKTVAEQYPERMTEASRRGLIVKSISDATDTEPMPPPWKQRAISIDRFSNRGFSARDADTLSMRSVGVRRISRTPSKTDLFVADIIIPSASLSKPSSRKGSRTDVPQINFIAPTPIREMKTPFSVYDEFRKNKESLELSTEKEEKNKENLSSNLESCSPKGKDFDPPFPPNSGQGSFSLANTAATSSFSAKDPNQTSRTTEISEQYGKPLNENQKLKRQYASEFDDPHTKSKHQMLSGFNSSVGTSDLFVPTEKYPTPKDKSFSMKSMLRSNKSEEECPKEEAFSFRSLFKSKKAAEKTEDLLEEEKPPPLKSALKQSKPILMEEPIKMEEISQISSISLRQGELMMVGDEEKLPERNMPLVIATSIKQAEPIVSHETFSLKVDELDQYSINPKKNSLTPIKPSQSLKSSNIDLTQPVDSRSIRLPTPQKTFFNPTVIPQPEPGKPHLFKRSDILRTSEPNLLNQQIMDRNMRERSSTPMRQGNLVSVAIDIPHPEIVEQSDHGVCPEESFEPTEPHVFMPIEPQRSARAPREETVQISVPRAASKDRLMQSKLLQRKDYFDRTQSQDRAAQRGGSVGDLQSANLPKTVSFDFGTHQSRFADHEGQIKTFPRDKKDWVERTYFMRELSFLKTENHRYATGRPLFWYLHMNSMSFAEVK